VLFIFKFSFLILKPVTISLNAILILTRIRVNPDLNEYIYTISVKKRNGPKILIVTIPIRPVPTGFPPLGSLSVITALNKAGFADTEFYDIDYLRPDYSDVLDYIKKNKPDILGISAVVSTAYRYSKNLSIDIKKILPDTTIILGGNLGASAEIILEKTGVDFVCTGEGEVTIIDFVECWRSAHSKEDFESVQGLAYLGKDQNLVITPFPEPVSADEVYDVDWSILDKLGHAEYFFPKVGDPQASDFSKDPQVLEPHRAGKRIALLPGSKGCVARCTFCHRWDKGIRYIPVPEVMKRIDFLIQKYNVGYISFADENFGTDRKWLALFIEEIKSRDIIWRVGGMRVNTINPEAIKKMKDAGCIYIQFGMESGSQKMLDVMEKVTKIEQNYNAIKWLAENKFFTTVQLVIGMPGETPETIEETCRFTSFVVEQSPQADPNALSINFAQALPGTPLYEAGRRNGIIGQTVDDEEKYLLEISGRDARDGETYMNLTDYPKLYLEKWHFEIQNRTRHAYVKKWGLDRYYNIVMQSNRYEGLKEWEGYKNRDNGYFADPARQSETRFNSEAIPTPWSLLKQKRIGAASTFYPNFFWRTRGFSLLYVLLNIFQKQGVTYAVELLSECVRWKINSFIGRSISSIPEYISLRKLIRKKLIPEVSGGNPAMDILRKGR
jgi:anaerobic magnesium-protoporphyrin IX monomethyl ester cyclase